MRQILKYLALILAAVLVFGAARLMDSAPWREAPVQPVRQTAVFPEPETEPVLTETEAPTEAPTEATEQRFWLTFAGDCTLGSREAHAVSDYGFYKIVGEDYGYPFRNVADWFSSDELTLVNLEGVLCEEGEPVTTGHVYRGPAAYSNILAQSSVEVASLANDHTMDYGQAGYDSTKASLEEAGVSWVERDIPCLLTTENGLTVGICGAVSPSADTEAVTAAICSLREQAELVIFAPHWGIENSSWYSAEQTELAYAAIDAGADIVWGCHPRVLQEVEEYNGGKIFYSLGSFCFGGAITLTDYDSALIRQEVIRSANGTVSLGETLAVPVCVSSFPGRNNYQPVPYEAGTRDYVRVMEKLGLGGKN